MTPATTNLKTYQGEAQYQARPSTASTNAGDRGAFRRKVEAGINWFSRNLTGQQKPSNNTEL